MDIVDQIKARLDGREPPTILYPELSGEIVGAAIEVHRHIGPGQLESVYQRSMTYELRRRALVVRTQVPVPMFFEGDRVGDFFADLIVEDSIILELKAIDRFKGVHTAQLLSYLHAANLRLGMLMNFNVSRMVHGVKRVVRDRPIVRASQNGPSSRLGDLALTFVRDPRGFSRSHRVCAWKPQPSA